MSITPATAGVATLVSVGSLVLLSPRWGGTIYVGLLVVVLLLAQVRAAPRVGRKLVLWTLPFVLPLIFIHAVLNAQFTVTGWWLERIPIRSAGLMFGYDMSVRVELLSVVAAYWLSVDRDAFVEALIRFRLPTPLIMLAMQGVVMGGLVQKRIEAIHLAQRARGIPVSASLAQRIVHIPALLIPVVVGTFVEAEARVPVLLAHGYGRLEASAIPAKLELRTVFLAFAILACLAVALRMDRLF